MQSTSFRLLSVVVTVLLLVGLVLVVRLALLNNPTTPPRPVAPTTRRPVSISRTPAKTVAVTPTPTTTNQLVDKTVTALEPLQRVEAGGFAFRPLRQYTLEVQNNAVNILGTADAAAVGDAFLLSGGAPAQFTTKAASKIEEIFDQYVNFYAQKDNFRIGDRQPIQVDRASGFAVDLTSSDATKHFAGRIAMVQPSPGQIFVMVGIAPAEQWQAATVARFAAVLTSIKFFPLASTPSPTPTLTAVTTPSATLTQRPTTTQTATNQRATPVKPLPQANGQTQASSQWQSYANANKVNALAVYNGKIWAATQGGIVAWSIDNDSLVKFTTLDGLAANHLTSVVACPLPGLGIVFGTSEGLQIFDTKSGNWRLLNNENSPMSFNDVAVLICSVENSFLLVGYRQHGLDIFDARTGVWSYINQKNGLQNDFVDAVAVVGNREAIWVSSGFGVSVVTPQAANDQQAPTGQQPPTFFDNNNSALETNQITAMTVDKSGTVWLGARDAVYKASGNSWTVYNKLSVLASRFPAGDMNGLAAAADGTLWIGASTGEICHFDPVKVQCLDFFASAEDSTKSMARGKLTHLLLDPAENVYYATDGGGLSRYDGKNWRTFVLPNEPLVGDQIHSLAQTKDGSLWIATEKGIQQLNPTTNATAQVFTPENSGLPLSDTGVLYADKAGGVWFGGQGASYFNGSNWAIYTAADGLANGLVQAIAIDSQQRVWLGTKSGLSIWNGSSFFNLSKATGLPSDDVTALLADGDKMWIGANGGGLFRFEQNQLQLFDTEKMGLPSSTITALAKDKNGLLLVGTNRGLARLQEGVATPLGEMNGYAITNIKVMPDGKIWVGTLDDGLFYFDGQTWSEPPAGGKPPAKQITAILVDQRGAIWIGAKTGGLIRYMP
ncbi:MAG: two-component regulator propeller domain-containing protein [Caldilineaceae bacterium]